jgi:hypothetical protein
MAQEEKSIIRSLLDPTIVLDTMEFDDVEEETNPDSGSRGTKVQKQMGNIVPFIKINTYIVSESELTRMEINCTDFLPEISLEFVMSGPSTFISRDMPKDGDLINVFIRGRSDLFKPIRNDYLITNVSTSESGSPDGGGMVINLTGTLHIPTIHDEVNLAIKGTSYDTLFQIAESLGLGFASNDTHTSDEQYWVSTYDRYTDFIDEITRAAWKDENSFFTAYIDLYYHLNFINVNNQFTNSSEIDEALLDTLLSNDEVEGQEISTTNVKKIFTNIEDKRGTNMFIKAFSLENNSSDISRQYGYKMYAQFYEQNTLQNWEIFSEPLIVEGSENDKILLKGRPGEDFYKTQVRRKWLGVQYSVAEHNVHEKYLFSQVHNIINNKELEKMKVHIEVPRANFNIYRGERIPCIFISGSDPLKTPFIQQPEETTGEGSETLAQTGAPALDKFYSGFYMIQGMTFTYEARGDNDEYGVLTETVVLTRREWPTP